MVFISRYDSLRSKLVLNHRNGVGVPMKIDKFHFQHIGIKKPATRASCLLHKGTHSRQLAGLQSYLFFFSVPTKTSIKNSINFLGLVQIWLKFVAKSVVLQLKFVAKSVAFCLKFVAKSVVLQLKFVAKSVGVFCFGTFGAQGDTLFDVKVYRSRMGKEHPSIWHTTPLLTDATSLKIHPVA